MGKYALTPKQVVNNDLSFSIPIYQRLFTWSEEQIEPLLIDLLYNCCTANKEHYYIGLLTTKNSELVDGQQRFTVMTLIAIVLWKNFKDSKWKDFIFTQKEKFRLTFTARIEDQKYLESELNANVDGEKQEFHCGLYRNDLMANAIKTISSFFNEKIGPTVESFNLKDCTIPSIHEFSEYIFNNMAFFIQEIPNGYTPKMMNKYFETMNSTGKNLENHEILKVDLLKEAFSDGNYGDEYDHYVTMWNKASQMDRTIFPVSDDKSSTYLSMLEKIKLDHWDQLKQSEYLDYEGTSISINDIVSGRGINMIKGTSARRDTRFHSFLNFTDFLLQVLWIVLSSQNIRITTTRFFKREDLRKTFKDYWKYIGDKKEFIKNVYKYRVILDWSIIRVDGDGDYELLAESDKGYSKLEQYEAMMYASSSLYTYYLWVPDILKSVAAKGYDEQRLLNELKIKDDKTHEEPKGKLSYNQFDKYYFRRLDYIIWEKVISSMSKEELKKELLNEGVDFMDGVIDSIKAFKFHNYNSVEHLYPRNDSRQLKSEDGTNKAENSFGEALHSFGNLALVSDIFNSTQGYQSLDHKFVNIKEQIIKKKIESIKLVLMYCCAKGELKNWSVDASNFHQNKMMEILHKSYSTHQD